MHFLEWKWMNLASIALKFVPKVRLNNIPALVQIMAWRRPGDKPLSEPMMGSLLTHICVTRPQWVKTSSWVAKSLGSDSWNHQWSIIILEEWNSPLAISRSFFVVAVFITWLASWIQWGYCHWCRMCRLLYPWTLASVCLWSSRPSWLWVCMGWSWLSMYTSPRWIYQSFVS